MEELVCYICRQTLKDNDLIIPLDIVFKLPFGMFKIMVLQHYMCGLSHYLDNIVLAQNINTKDKTNIEGKLMEILNAMSKGTTQ